MSVPKVSMVTELFLNAINIMIENYFETDLS